MNFLVFFDKINVVYCFPEGKGRLRHQLNRFLSRLVLVPTLAFAKLYFHLAKSTVDIGAIVPKNSHRVVHREGSPSSRF